MGYCFYFRFVPDDVLHSRTMLTPVKVDRACPKTLPQPLRSPWYRFLSQSYNYFRYTSAIWSLWVKEASGEVGIYTSEILAAKNWPLEITSLSVSAVELLVLPVWGTVSTFDLYLMLTSEAGRYRYRWKWIGHARKLCRSRWHHVDISSGHQLITTSGFRPPSWIYNAGSVSLLSSSSTTVYVPTISKLFKVSGGGFGSPPPPLGTNVTKIGEVSEG